MLYGEDGVYKALEWKPETHDSYHLKYLIEPERWHCNLCDKYVSGYNKSKHEKSGRHKKKLDENGLTFDEVSRKYIQSNGEVFAVVHYNK